MNEQGTARLGTAPLGKLMLSLALPSVLAQLVNLLYNIVDRMYIGHIAGTGGLALTGLGLCMPLIMLVSAFAALAGNGGAPLASIELGKGERERAGEILMQAMAMLICLAAVLTALLLLCRRPLLFFFGASAETIGYAEDYIRVYLIGTVFVQLTLGLNPFILCQGQAKTAMFSVLIGAVSNIILDPIFIFLLGFGIRGAAIATVISQALSAAWVLWFLFSARSELKITAKGLLPKPKTMRSIAALGVSPFIMQATESLIAMVFTSGLQKYGSDLYVGSYTILQSVLQLIITPTHGFTYGVQPIMSYSFGAKDFGRVKRCFALVTVIVTAYTGLFFLCIYLWPGFFAGLFTADTALRTLAAEKLPIFLAGMSVFGLQISVQAAFLAMGQAKISIFIACLRKIILLTPLALILPLFLQTDGLYLAEPISDALSALTSIVLFLFTARKLFHVPKTMETLQQMGYDSGMSGS